ncbi:polysaccharide deacetylase family protein [Lyngbya sp. CCY1209]|uniref:polysaccharide deacetylase family protein n=1 Tax=Lyngbya sp. CCY1209 TaxID=2886103 RepID=UPI002D1FF4D4|nr:polysaccharide deacetylase family protein [Lyngbya sp. CCY1209]MEB3886637.1 polysaccharide deacetylase family protein [Lyngbya sp. CCY1209]
MLKPRIKLQFAFFYPLLYPLLRLISPNSLWTGNRSRKEIALTIDDGPHPRYTLELLDVLDKYGIKASFFWLGVSVDRHPEVAREVYRRGHFIGIHGYQHLSFTRLRKEELKQTLERTKETIHKTCGIDQKTLQYVRPPNGFFTWKTLGLLAEWGYRTVMWSVVPEDWVEPGVDAVVSRVLRQTKNGAIVVLHDGYFGGCDVAASVDKIVPELLRRGYNFVSIDEFWKQVKVKRQ